MTALPDDWPHLLPTEGWTLADIESLPEGSPMEVIDGVLIVNPSPLPFHQRISRRISNLLEASLPADWQVEMDVDVLLAKEPLTYLTPDVVVFDGTLPLTTHPIPCEAILLVVEVVSKGSRVQDRATKPFAYAEAGIPHYWRVETRQSGALATTVHTYRLGAEGYERTGEHTGRLVTDSPFAVDIALDRLTD
ncbi:MAG TPA: Uma2 family endonuclease [Actinophytocola sp.]|uniref:Uma2 family endonuclease n=1 Tax=Actinophytocola sp. TaxID=1872138 RepID=UPI002DBCACE1|nr:Uma2 family endonuclease [Actinophytocola sp.]HEU5471126.1 Uma2 family endonuclease [Actinophytocola sp.]